MTTLSMLVNTFSFARLLSTAVTTVLFLTLTTKARSSNRTSESLLPFCSAFSTALFNRSIAPTPRSTLARCSRCCACAESLMPSAPSRAAIKSANAAPSSDRGWPPRTTIGSPDPVPWILSSTRVHRFRATHARAARGRPVRGGRIDVRQRAGVGRHGQHLVEVDDRVADVHLRHARLHRRARHRAGDDLAVG